MFGCDVYPSGYPYTLNGRHNQCHAPQALGYAAAISFFILVMVGAYILPMVIIGIISIKVNIGL
jgi:hypothetical protein